MNTELKAEPKWVLVGKLFENCGDQGFKEPLSTGRAFFKLVELDSSLPIIRHKTKKQITRVQIYESLWNEISSKFISYFYNDEENQKFMREYLAKEFPSHPTAPYVSSENNFSIHVMNTENVLAAITEILAYSCSEKKISYRTSKAKMPRSSEDEKDRMYVRLLQMLSLHKSGKLSEAFFQNLSVTDYIEMFLPHTAEKIEELRALFISDQKDMFSSRLQKLIEEFESIVKRDDLLRERVTVAADAELTLCLSDKTLTTEIEHSSNELKTPEYLKYRRTTGQKMKQILRAFEEKHPTFKIERMNLIRNAILDLNNFLKTASNEKPIRSYREISKHIREYRNSESIYVFGKPYKPRKR